MMGLSRLQLIYVLATHPIFLNSAWILLTEDIIELLHPEIIAQGFFIMSMVNPSGKVNRERLSKIYHAGYGNRKNTLT
jgi:hypothetical protein